MSGIYNILDFGARPEETGLQTGFIQAAIDACAAGGGGTVVIPAGTYTISGIRLYSDMTLKLESGVRLCSSDNYAEYSNFHIPTTMEYVYSPEWIEKWHLPSDRYVNAIITCADCSNVSIIGERGSVIDGVDCYDPEGEESFRGPMGIRFTRCRNITLKGYTVKRSANWAHQIDGSRGIHIYGVTVLAGHDGIDLHHCSDIVIKDCAIKTGDDCVAGYDIKNLTVEGCVFNTSCNSFRVGAMGMAIRNCVFAGPGEYPHRVSGRNNTLCAFEYYSHAADKTQSPNGEWLIENCEFSNIDRLIHYDFPVEWALQMTVPLKNAEFIGCRFDNIKNVSVFRTRDGSESKISFRNCAFKECAEPFIETE